MRYSISMEGEVSNVPPVEKTTAAKKSRFISRVPQAVRTLIRRSSKKEGVNNKQEIFYYGTPFDFQGLPKIGDGEGWGAGIYLTKSRNYAESYARGGESYRQHIAAEAKGKPRNPQLIKITVAGQANIVNLEIPTPKELENAILEKLNEAERTSFLKRYSAFGSNTEAFKNALAQTVPAERYVAMLREAGIDGFRDLTRDEIAILNPAVLKRVGTEKLTGFEN